MSQQALLRRVVRALDDAGVAHMLTGSLASSLQGEPRATHDIDLVIDAAGADQHSLVTALAGPGLHLDEEAVAEAVQRRGMFNLIDSSTGDKVDLWLLKGDDEYDAVRFARRTVVRALGLSLTVSAPEDTILMKLRWARLSGGSEKQLGDALGVYEVQEGVLDQAYLDEWAARLGVAGDLAALRARAEPLSDPEPISDSEPPAG